MTDELRSTVEKELAGVDDLIDRLTRYKTALKATIEAAAGIDNGPPNPLKDSPYVPQAVTSIKGLTEGKVPVDGQPNTLDMARMVLLNLNGEEKTPDEIRMLIRSTYGIDAAKSLDQMLYKRAGKNRTFYKTAEGRFGLLELRVVIEDMHTPATAYA